MAAPALGQTRDELNARGIATLFDDINAKRAASREPALQLDADLCKLAAAHAKDMAEHDYFSHYSPDGTSPSGRMTQAHYAFHHMGENIAEATGVLVAAAGLWGSQPHRANMLGAYYTKVGIGLAPRGDGEILIVEDFSD